MLMKHVYVVFWTFFLFVSLRDSVGVGGVLFSDVEPEDECAKAPEKRTNCPEQATDALPIYYNKTAGGCFPFYYTGCEASDNNFPDKDTCQQSCDPTTWEFEEYIAQR
uniref:Putative bpti/kunitz family of serine protease inhibitor n=1 Tax=Amblyomma americanum TaxID=6943 RepID=A0A0C9SD17_AMBAM